MKKVIITGATRGFGLAYSNILKDKNFNVIRVASKNADFNFDLSTIKGTDSLIKLITDEKPNLVILNAGFGGTKPFNEYEAGDITSMQHINGTSKALILNKFFNKIKNGEIKFIVASSIAGKLPSPLMAPYSASKAYCSNLIDSLNAEIFASGSNNFIIDASPGNVNTKLQSHEVVDYAMKVLNSNGRVVFNKDLYVEVLKKPANNWEDFVKKSYDKKMKRINDKKI